MKKLMFGLSVLAMAGCVINNVEAETAPIKDPAVIQLAQQLVSGQMRDPEATRFKNEYSAYKTKQGDYIVCGTLNAKNAMGGYVGYKPFYVRIRNREVAAFAIPSENDQYNVAVNAVRKTCSDAAAGKVMVSS